MSRLKPPSKEASALLPPYAALPDHAIFVPANAAEFAAARSALLAQTALGFDTESKPIFHVDQVDTGPHVVQLATPTQAWLLQLHHPQALTLAREVIANAHICKVGFGLDNDKSTLPKRLGVPLSNVVDLDRVFQQHGYGSSTGVRAAMALVLGQNFHKSKKNSTSNWAALQLSAAQIRYAANDAHAPALVYAALPDWQARQPALNAAHTPRHSRTTTTAPTPCCTASHDSPQLRSAPQRTATPAAATAVATEVPDMSALPRLPQRPRQIAALLRRWPQ